MSPKACRQFAHHCLNTALGDEAAHTGAEVTMSETLATFIEHRIAEALTYAKAVALQHEDDGFTSH